jgi:hypothetical protein
MRTLGATLLLAAAATGQSFQPGMLGTPTVLTNVSLMEPAYATDFDGDGGVDLMSVDYQHIGFTSFPQRADGSWAPGTVFDMSALFGLPRVRPADFDADGRMDAASLDTGGIVVRLGLGGGDFGVKHFSPSPVKTWDTIIEAADYNGDGLPDGLVAGRGNQQSGIILGAKGKGDGTLGSFGVLAVTRRPTQSLSVDLDVDGDLDVVILEDDSVPPGLVVLRNPGNGVLVQTDFSLPLQQHSLSNAADLDGDGIPDLVSCGTYDNTVGALMGDGNCGFTQLPLLNSSYVDAVVLTDLDADGFPDLAASEGAYGFGHLVLQRLVRGLPQDLVVDLPISASAGQITAADTDGDGLQDVIAAWSLYPGDSLRVYRNLLGPFIDVGLGDPDGPQLAVSGQASPGGEVTLSLQPAFGHPPGVLLAGVAPLLHVSPAGLIVPDPLVLLPLLLPASLPMAWPAELGPGTLVYLQGVSLSSPPHAGNAVVIVPQP